EQTRSARGGVSVDLELHRRPLDEQWRNDAFGDLDVAGRVAIRDVCVERLEVTDDGEVVVALGGTDVVAEPIAHDTVERGHVLEQQLGGTVDLIAGRLGEKVEQNAVT